jgi:hypothetical protein
MLFQVSCQKEANARINNTTQQNKLVYFKIKEVGSTEIASINICNIDGTNNVVVPIILPSGEKLAGDVAITPDGSEIIFSATDTNPTTYNGSIYTCNTDGSGLRKIISEPDFGYGYLNPF